MKTDSMLVDVKQAVADALDTIPHDRWVVASVRDSTVRTLIQSDTELVAKRTDLAPLARRCLFERRPVLVDTFWEQPPDAQNALDWETTWPTLIYVPIGLAAARPVGLLVIGSKTRASYSVSDVGYLISMGRVLTRLVAVVDGPLSKLHGVEIVAARLLKEGLSEGEIAAALGTDLNEARRVVSAVLRKLSARSRHSIPETVPDNQVVFGSFVL